MSKIQAILTPAHAAVIDAAVAWLDGGEGEWVELIFAVKNLRKQKHFHADGQVDRHRKAERAVIGTVKQFLSIYNNEKVSDPNAAAWAIGEMESAVATLRELEGA